MELVIQTQRPRRSCPSRVLAAGWCRIGIHCCGDPYWPFLECHVCSGLQQSSHLKGEVAHVTDRRSKFTNTHACRVHSWGNSVDVLDCLYVSYLQKLVHKLTPLHYLYFLGKYLKNLKVTDAMQVHHSIFDSHPWFHNNVLFTQGDYIIWRSTGLHSE